MTPISDYATIKEGQTLFDAFQILEAGQITAGDEIVIESTPEHGVTVSDVYQLVSGDRDPDRIARVLNCPELPEEMHTRVSGYNK